MKKVLFICAGNVARSQMAEAFYNHFSISTNAISAGVLIFTPRKYKYPIPEVVSVMREEGIDVSKKKVKTVTVEMVEDASEIYVLCPEEKVPDFVAKSGKVKYWDIKDPYGKKIEEFRKIRQKIKKKVKGILKDKLQEITK